MVKINFIEKKMFREVIGEDLMAIERKMAQQIDSIWDKAKLETEKVLGYDKIQRRISVLNKRKEKLEQEINDLEHSMRNEKLTVSQIKELGGTPDRYGYHRGAEFFGKSVTSQFEYKIVKYIEAHIDLWKPLKFLRDLGRSAMRELAMCGSFEDAQKVYDKFYGLNFRKFGVDIPPRLEEIKTKSKMLAMAQEVLQVEHKPTEA